MSNSKFDNKIIFFIVNPIAGNGKSKKRFPIIENYLINNNVNFEVQYTESKGHAVDIANNIKKREDIIAIVAVGGDGTLFEVINGLYYSAIPVGYIPMGTGNDFGRAMNIPSDPILAVQKLLEMNVRKIDIGKINDLYFINVASIGFDADVADYVNKSRFKSILGKLIYVLGVISVLFSLKTQKIKIEIDNQHYEFNNTWLIAIANNKYYGGGILISPNSINNDGLFDICIIKDLSKIRFLKLFPTVFKGTHIQHKPMVEFLNGKKIKISLENEILIQADGEIIHSKEIELENIKKGLYVI